MVSDLKYTRTTKQVIKKHLTFTLFNVLLVWAYHFCYDNSVHGKKKPFLTRSSNFSGCLKCFTFQMEIVSRKQNLNFYKESTWIHDSVVFKIYSRQVYWNHTSHKEALCPMFCSYNVEWLSALKELIVQWRDVPVNCGTVGDTPREVNRACFAHRVTYSWPSVEDAEKGLN